MKVQGQVTSPPADVAAGVEIPAATRDRLGLQDGPCWVIVTEVNIFVWPGPDLRHNRDLAPFIEKQPMSAAEMRISLHNRYWLI